MDDCFDGGDGDGDYGDFEEKGFCTLYVGGRAVPFSGVASSIASSTCYRSSYEFAADAGCNCQFWAGDVNNDGVVDADELREAIRAIAVRQGKFADDEKAMEKFIVVALSEIDLDNDGVITVDEIEQWFEKYEEVVEDTQEWAWG